MNDFKHALRQLVRRPGLSVVVIVMLALGIGATTAIYSLFHQILVQPLPVPEPGRLVTLRETGPKAGAQWCGGAGICDVEHTFSYATFRDLEAGQSVFSGIAGYAGGFNANLAYGGATLSGTGMLVSGQYFQALNLSPALGRLIGPQDTSQIGGEPVAVLSHDYWHSHFGASADVLGRTLIVNGHALTIVGVAPERFSGTSQGTRPQVFMPLTLFWTLRPARHPVFQDPDRRTAYWVHLFARLDEGMTREQAQAGLTGLYQGILEEEVPVNPQIPEEYLRLRQLSLDDGSRGQSALPETAARPLTLLLGITVLVQLIVCVNVANLLLARGASRAGELALRASLGASRGRLASQLLTEVGVLAVAGIIACLPVALGTLALINALLPGQLAGALAIELNAGAAFAALGVSLATVLLIGLVPAVQATRAEPAAATRRSATQSTASRGARRVLGILTTAQIAFAMALLVLAGLFAQSLANVARVDLGMDVDSLVSFSVSPRLSGYGPEQAAALYERLEDALAAQPGLTSVASATVPVIAGRRSVVGISVEGLEPAPDADRSAMSNVISPGFFSTLSIPLQAGRDFTRADSATPLPPVIVNESFARKFDLGSPSEAIGRRLCICGPDGEPDLQIAGVVADARYADVKEDVPPQVFVPRSAPFDDIATLHFYVRAGVDADALMGTIRRVVGEIDPSLPVAELTTLRRQLQDNVYIDRVVAWLSAVFAGLATLLAAIGLYGVVAYNVTQRTRELGLRLALGAEPGQVRTMVLKHVGAMGLTGAGLGLAAALGLGRAAEALLFGLSASDPGILGLAVAALGLVVLTASWLPARRASNIAPMEALRHE